MPRRLRAALSGGLAGLSQGFEDVVNYRLAVKRQQEAAEYRDQLLRQRQEDEAQRKLEADLRAGLITSEQYEATRRGDIEGMRPSIATTMEGIIGDPKSAPDIRTPEEVNARARAKLGRIPFQPLVSPTRTDRGIDVFEGPSATASLMDPQAAESMGVLKAQRRKFEAAQAPETRGLYDPTLGAKVERTRQFSPVTGEFREMTGQAQLEPTGEQKGKSELETWLANQGDPERLRREREAEAAKERILTDPRAASAAAVHEAQLGVEQKRGVGAYKPEKPTLPTVDEKAAFDFNNRLLTEHAIMLRLEPHLAARGALITFAQIREPNLIKDPQIRQYVNAVRRGINAQLRRDSGAAITASEYADFGDAYTWVPGDDALTIRQKQDARRHLLEGGGARAGRLGLVFITMDEAIAAGRKLGLSPDQALKKARSSGYKVIE